MFLERFPGRTVAERSDGLRRSRNCHWILAGGFEGGHLRLNAAEQIFPGYDERRGAFTLKIGRELFIVDASLGKRGDRLLGIAAILRQHLTHSAVIGEREQRLL